MYTPHPEFGADRAVAALLDGWGLEATSIEPALVGYGSHHWRVEAGADRWFFTLDDLAAKARDASEPLPRALERLTAALTTARALRDSGLSFVVAPEPTPAGDVIHVVAGRFALALYPHIDGRARSGARYDTDDDRMAVVGLIAALHDAPRAVRAGALLDDLRILSRAELEAGLRDLDNSWDTGPYGSRARGALAAHATVVERALERFDRLAAVVRADTSRMVLTHGEPHAANTMATATGVVLVDWDTVLVAAPERDLWAMAADDRRVLDEYEARRGVTPDRDALEAYRLSWNLTDLALFVAEFRRPHTDNDDTAVAWNGLTTSLSELAREVGGDRRLKLRADCSQCVGLCCVAPAFTASADFAFTKPAGHACRHLTADFRCAVHGELSEIGMRGCTAYDCLGAGQRIARALDGRDWRSDPGRAQIVFAAFALMEQLHELEWYLAEGLARESARDVHDDITRAIADLEAVAGHDVDTLAAVDANALRAGVEPLLARVSESVRAQGRAGGVDHRGADLIGRVFAGADLRGASFRGAYLIGANLHGADLAAADLLGADLRGADVGAARLAEAQFLTQFQVNAANGDTDTTIPSILERPAHWR